MPLSTIPPTIKTSKAIPSRPQPEPTKQAVKAVLNQHPNPKTKIKHLFIGTWKQKNLSHPVKAK